MSRQTPRRRRPRVANWQAALAALAVIAAACYAVFGGSLPFGGSAFVLRAVFTANTNLHIPSPVRIAGVQVGEVTAVQRIKGSPDAGVVVMRIDSSGLPLHADATAQIRSRIFLEGNFYVDLHPGTPSSPLLASGATLPAANTAGPVQLDRVLSALNAGARANLQKLVQGLGGALNQVPTPAQQRGQDPAVARLTGAQGLNYSLNYAARAFEASAIVNQALLGTHAGDLSGAVRGESRVLSALAAGGRALPELVSNLDITAAALAARQSQLAAAVALLPGVLRRLQSAEAALSASFAPTERFAARLIPGIQQLGPTIVAALPWLGQMTALMSARELGGLLGQLAPAAASSSRAIGSATTLVSAAQQLSRCLSNVLVPTGNQTITVDSSPPNGLKLYQQLLQSAVGLDSAAQNFDGNGRYLRASVGGGANQVKTASLANGGSLYGNAVLPPQGTLPAFPSSGRAPALDGSVPCYTQSAPNLNSAVRGATP